MEENKNNIFSIMSLILGILSIILEISAIFGIPIVISLMIAVISIVLGIIAIVLRNKVALPIIGIVTSSISLIIAITVIFMTPVIKNIKNEIDTPQTNDSNYLETNHNNYNDNNYELKLNKATLIYDSTKWKLNNSTETSNKKEINGTYGVISFKAQTSNYTFTNLEVIDELEKKYKEQGYNIVAKNEITINGKNWAKISVNKEGTSAMQLLYVDGYTTYIFTYQTSSAIFYTAEIKDVEAVYKTLTISGDNLITNTNTTQNNSIKNDKISGNSWLEKNYNSLLKLNNNNTFEYYKDSKDLTNNYYEGTYKVYNGDEAIEYVTKDLKKYGVTEEELNGVFSRNTSYSADNFCCIVLENKKCMVNGTNTLNNTVITPYYGFYLSGDILDIVNMNSATRSYFAKQ